MQEREVMTTKQLAEYLQLSYDHVRHLATCTPDRLPPYRMVGSRRRYYLEDVRRWLNH